MHPRVLVVDDEPANLLLIERILASEGYSELRSTTDPREAIALITDWHPDILLLDLHMPHLDGFQVMETVAAMQRPTDYLPILVLTADVTREVKERALSAGAKDFLSKPFERAEMVLRVRNLLETRFLHLQLAEENRSLDRELDSARLEIFDRLAVAAEYRDDATGEHTRRVGVTAARIAVALGKGSAEVRLLGRAAALHDVGKIGIPDSILLKPGRLTAEEFEVMKAHTNIGQRILSGSQSHLMRMAEAVAASHHERWDGTGYPLALAGDDIPLWGRITAVADVFDALTHERPYKRAWPVDAALDEIRRSSGTQFDPAVVRAFLTAYENSSSKTESA